MKYSLVALTLATAVLAKPAFTNSAFDVQEGKPIELTFSGCDDGCTILLKNGPATDLKTVDTLTTGAKASFTWTPSGLPTDTYAFEIKDASGETNWSSRFEYEGTGAPKTATTAAAETTTKKAEPTSQTTMKTVKTTTSAEEKTTTTPVANTTTPVSTPAATTTGAGKTTSTKAEETTGTSASQPSTVPNSSAMRTTSSLALLAGAVMAFAFLN